MSVSRKIKERKDAVRKVLFGKRFIKALAFEGE